STRRARTVLRDLVRQSRAADRQACSWWRCVHVPTCERSPVSGAGRVGRADARIRFCRRRLPILRGRNRRAAHRSRAVTALASIRDAPGLDAYLEELDERLEHVVTSHRGIVAEIAADVLTAGGKPLRP